ncbi:MAG: PRC-barrel domain-containing protein [Hyphomicrobiaceae bacterium]
MPIQPPHSDVIRASRVIGASVHVQGGDRFGRISDIVLNKLDDIIQFVIVARDGALTATDNFYSVHWSDLNFDEDVGGYVLPFDSDGLEKSLADSSVQQLIDEESSPTKIQV